MGLWDNVDLKWLVLPHKNCHPLLFYAWRIAYSVYVAVLFYLYDQSFEPDRRFPKTLIYLTVWCGLFVALSAVLILIFHILTGFGNFVNQYFDNLQGCGLVVARITYLIYEIAVSMQLLVPALYWVGQYPAIPDAEKPTGYVLFLEINLHGLFTVLIAMDYLFSQIDVIKSHLWVQQAFAISYIIFNYWYTTNYGIIYPIISWDNAFTYIFVVIAILFSILGFYLCAFIGGALVLMVLRSQTLIQAASAANTVDPVPGWQQEAIFMLFIFGAALVFFYVTEKIGEMKDGRKPGNTNPQPSENNELLAAQQEQYIELPLHGQTRALNHPATQRLDDFSSRVI